MPGVRFPSGRRAWWVAWTALAVSAAGFALYGAPAYLTGDRALSRIPINPDVVLHYLYLVSHALPASLILLLGPMQFVPALRNRYRKLHRVVGRVYMVNVVIASVAAILAATFTLNGFPVQVAFYLLAAAWLYSLSRAFLAIRRRQIALHRVWMMRNYALSFAAVVLRVLLLVGLAVRSRYEWLTFDDVYTSSVWASILISSVVGEWFVIHRTRIPPVRGATSEERTAATARP